MSSTTSLPDAPTQSAKALPSAAGRQGYFSLESLFVGLALLLALCSLLAVVLRLTVRDRFDSLAMVYYATPPLLVSFAAWLSLAILLRFRRTSAALATGILAIGCLLWSLASTWVVPQRGFAAADATGRPLRVLFWNCARGVGGWDGVAEEIRRHAADIIGLVEAGEEYNGEMHSFWKKEFPGYRVESSGNGIFLLTRGEILGTQTGRLGSGSRYAEHDVIINGERLAVVVVDISSSLKRSRDEPLRNLVERYRRPEYHRRGTLIMGDMNTPTDSVFLQPMREEFSLAFDLAGSGYAPTWPVPFPLITLDQVWVNRRIQVKRCELFSSRCSDHRPVLTELMAGFETESDFPEADAADNSAAG